MCNFVNLRTLFWHRSVIILRRNVFVVLFCSTYYPLWFHNRLAGGEGACCFFGLLMLCSIYHILLDVIVL